jgi:hypothetical protein
MAQIIDYRGGWKLDRHKWKKLVSRSGVLNRAAKHFARQLCDDFANHKTACCWMSNDTLADHLGVDCRTVQRYIKLLKADGWIVDVKIWPYRRALQLVFAKRVKRDIEDGNKATGEAKPLSSNHDRNVAASYIEPKNNLKRDLGVPKNSTPHRCVHVSKDEENCIEGWASWVDANTEFEFDVLLPLLLTNGMYAFPSRFPSEDPTEVARYLQFFDEVIASNGRILR